MMPGDLQKGQRHSVQRHGGDGGQDSLPFLRSMPVRDTTSQQCPSDVVASEQAGSGLRFIHDSTVTPHERMAFGHQSLEEVVIFTMRSEVGIKEIRFRSKNPLVEQDIACSGLVP